VFRGCVPPGTTPGTLSGTPALNPPDAVLPFNSVQVHNGLAVKKKLVGTPGCHGLRWTYTDYGPDEWLITRGHSGGRHGGPGPARNTG
jgi:hypothetical protein